MKYKFILLVPLFILFFNCSTKKTNLSVVSNKEQKVNNSFIPADGECLFFVGQDLKATGGVDGYHDGYCDYFDFSTGITVYTNLSPGDYVFKVRSRNLGSEWANDYSSLNIKILKPFWLEWWAFLLYAILGISLFYALMKYLISWEKMKADLRFEKFSHEKDVELYNLKQDFFTNISHEIRTPVTLILSSINKLLKNNELSENQPQNPFGTIKKNGEYLLNLVNELLDFRKLEQQQIKLKVVKGDWVSFSQEIYLSFKEFAYQKDIRFEFESSSPTIALWFDQSQMGKVLYNLFSNALKFTRAGGAIKLSITETDSDVQLKLVDEGIGISKKHLSKIFNRFYQANDSNSSNGTGFGLGLTISNEIVQLHHGEISVTSKKGSGSTFIIRLKKGSAHYNETEIGESETNNELIDNYFITKPDTRELITPNSESNTIKEQTLLIVEDNLDIRNYIVELLSDEFTILQASNGKEGLEIALEKSPDLIISDVMMPIMDGIELTHNLKTNVTTSHIPVILLTARASFMNKMEGFETGADDYITKPFNESLLRARIKNILKNRSLLHEKFNSEDSNDVGELVKNKKDQEFLENLGQFIEKNIDSDNLSANFVAQELGMSHSVLYKKLKTITGLSLVEYMRDYRLKKAKQLLKTKQFTLNEVCYQVGYSDRKYFSKLFKERFGNPPTFYMKEK